MHVPSSYFTRFTLYPSLAPLVLFVAVVGCAQPPPDGNDNDNGNGVECDSGQPMTDTATVSYINDIVPIFSQRGCLSASCHGSSFPPSSYDLRTYESSFRPGDEAQVFEICPIVPGDPESSYIIEKLSADPRSGQQMPLLRTPLPDEEIELIATWIREGALNN